MNPERMIIAAGAVAIVALAGWNVQLNGQIAELQAAAQVEPLASAAGAHGDDPTQMRHRRGRDRADRADREHTSERSHTPRPGGSAENVVVEGHGSEEGDKPRERRRPDFGAMRAEMESQTVEIVEAFASQSSWEPGTTDQVVDILLQSGESVGEIWREAHQEDAGISPYQARKETHAIRMEADDEIVALVGQDQADELGEQLWMARRDSFRRSH